MGKWSQIMVLMMMLVACEQQELSAWTPVAQAVEREPTPTPTPRSTAQPVAMELRSACDAAIAESAMAVAALKEHRCQQPAVSQRAPAASSSEPAPSLLRVRR